MKRRDFVSALAGTGLAACFGGAGVPGLTGQNGRARPIGIQLYTVRNLMQTDPAATLAQVAKVGYQEVEFHSLYRRTAVELRKMLDDSGLTAPATHAGINILRTNLQKAFDDAAALGHKWILVPSLDGTDRTADGYKRAADTLNEVGAKAKPLGLRVGYHNHEYEFKATGGKLGLDTLIENTDPSLVDFELDLFWIRRGGGDPLAYFTRYPGRWVAVHAKDMAADGKMVNVGEGVMDFATLFAAGAKAGVKHFFVEHDEPTDAMRDIAISYASMRKLLDR
jgi:sugar phosphate isomerase/epimerase